MTGTVESRYLDTFNGILALERDKATVNRLTLRHTGPGQGEAGATKRPGRGGRERREEAERQKKPPVKTLSSGSLLKEYRVEKQRPATPTVQEELEVTKIYIRNMEREDYDLIYRLTLMRSKLLFCSRRLSRVGQFSSGC